MVLSNDSTMRLLIKSSSKQNHLFSGRVRPYVNNREYGPSVPFQSLGVQYSGFGSQLDFRNLGAFRAQSSDLPSVALNLMTGDGPDRSYGLRID